MQVASKRIGAIFAAACVFFALAFGGVAAWAEGSWWQHPAEGDTLIVNAASSDFEFLEDLNKANVVVDVQKIATATPNDGDQAFTYELLDAFAGAGTIPDSTTAEPAKVWQSLADKAAELATVTPSGNATMQLSGSVLSATLTGLDDGIYLVVAHGPNQTEASDVTDPDTKESYKAYKAFSPEHEYSFRPTVVALPSKAADASGTIKTDGSYGDWLTEVTIAMKPKQGDRYGKLRIKKIVTDRTESKQDSTFVFHIVGKTPSGKDYDNYAQVNYIDGETKDAIVTMIPAGTTGTVTEINHGAGFSITGEETVSFDPIDADASDEQMVFVTFENTRTTPENPMRGIENNFTYVGETGEDQQSQEPWTWDEKHAAESGFDVHKQ